MLPREDRAAVFGAVGGKTQLAFVVVQSFASTACALERLSSGTNETRLAAWLFHAVDWLLISPGRRGSPADARPVAIPVVSGQCRTETHDLVRSAVAPALYATSRLPVKFCCSLKALPGDADVISEAGEGERIRASGRGGRECCSSGSPAPASNGHCMPAAPVKPFRRNDVRPGDGCGPTAEMLAKATFAVFNREPKGE